MDYLSDKLTEEQLFKLTFDKGKSNDSVQVLKSALSSDSALASLIKKEHMMGHTGLVKLDKNYFKTNVIELAKNFNYRYDGFNFRIETKDDCSVIFNNVQLQFTLLNQKNEFVNHIIVLEDMSLSKIINVNTGVIGHHTTPANVSQPSDNIIKPINEPNFGLWILTLTIPTIIGLIVLYVRHKRK